MLWQYIQHTIIHMSIFNPFEILCVMLNVVFVSYFVYIKQMNTFELDKDFKDLHEEYT